MDSVIAFKGSDFVIMAADASAARSIVVFKQTEDKILALDAHKMMGIAGPTGDRVNFSEYVQKNLHLYALRNSIPLSTHAAAHFTRTVLAEALRQGPYQCDILLAGYDDGKGPALYFMDYLGSMHPVEKGAHGYSAFFVSSIMDRNWRDDLNLEEGKELMRKCIGEVQRRLLLSQPKFIVKVVDKSGVRVIGL